jgi:hypothetical protein
VARCDAKTSTATMGADTSKTPAPTRRKVLKVALRLSARDRLALAAELRESVQVERAWAKEIRRRVRELEDGTVKVLTKEEALRIVAADPPRRPRRRGAAPR